MFREFSRQRLWLTFFGDWLGSLAALLAAVWLRTGQLVLPIPPLSAWLSIEPRWEGVFSSAWPAEILPASVFLYVLCLWPFFLYVFGVYDGQRNGSLKSELLNILLAVSVGTLALAGLLFFSFRGTSRLLILQFYALDVALLIGARLVLWAARRGRPLADRRQTRVLLVVGEGPARRLAPQLRMPGWDEVRVIGYVSDEGGALAGPLARLPRLGGVNEAAQVAAAHGAQAAVVALPWADFERISALCRDLRARRVQVHVAPDGNDSDEAVIGGEQSGIHGARRLIKRGLDVLGATLGLLVCAPLLLIISASIWLDSRGPVLFRQQRIGENGRPFTMLKFRTMRAGADTRLHQAHVARLITENLPLEDTGEVGSLKLANDPRITRVGALLRKTSLDELPQLLNVLAGEMSLVGPRPPLAYEVALYQDWHRRRLAAPPGMTGLWQVRGRNRVSFDDMVRMDLQYIDQQSLWLDLKLLLQTPAAVVTGRGAG